MGEPPGCSSLAERRGIPGAGGLHLRVQFQEAGRRSVPPLRDRYSRGARFASIFQKSRVHVFPPSFDPSARQRKWSGVIA
jgi:hypothetical protein